jgi:hypothetical protein
MSRMKSRLVVIAGAALLLLSGVTIVLVKHERTVYADRFQGAWEGALHYHGGNFQRTQRIVLKIFKENAASYAMVDQVDSGIRNLPSARLDVGWKSVHFELGTGFSYTGTLNGNAPEITGRWKWPGGDYSQPLTLARTTTPDTVPEPLAEADYTPRAGSDLQGLWKGTLKMRNRSYPLHLKIAESPDGTLRVELNSISQSPVVPVMATTASCRKPHVKLWFQGIGAAFDADLNNTGSQMTGTWTQIGADSITFSRADLKEEIAVLNAGKSYRGTNDSEPQGHWTGILPAGHGLRLRMAVNIARQSDGSFSATLDSPDQSLFAMPFDVVLFASPVVHLELKSYRYTFDGKLADDKVSGTWTFDKRDSSPLTLARKPSD